MIEFIDGEEVCRWNGIPITEEFHMKLFGVPEEIFMEDDIIGVGTTYYTDKSLYDVLCSIGTIVKDKMEWQDGGVSTGDHLVLHLGSIQDLEIKPYKDFKKDYPRFDEEEYNSFYNDLDAYYENKEYLKDDV